jgi:type VI secretion system secreted protein VgrG
MDGDPDRPVIVGSVYNGTNQSPYAMPANATQSGVRSRSSMGGTSSNYNEMLFEDKMGSEQLSFTAAKDHLLTVKNDSTTSITNSKKTQVGTTLEVTACTSITHSTGPASITMNAEGITLSVGAASITLTTAGIITIKGAMTTVEGVTTINGPSMLINVPEGLLVGPIPIPPM